MNKVTKEIAEWLNVSLEMAAKVQYEMECNGVDFSESSERTLRKEAKETYKELQK